MVRRTVVSRDETHVLELLEARYGCAPPQTRLTTLIRRNPQLDPLDWSLLVMSVEIDLKVSVSRRLLDPSRWTVAQFARSVALLPKVSRATHTIDLLTLLSEELLRIQTLFEQPQQHANRRPHRISKTARGRCPDR